MRKGGGKFKGRSYENDLANMFTEWSGLKWKRVPMSGGFQKSVVTGDIFCVAEYENDSEKDKIWIPFSLEAKKRQSWDLVQFFKDSDKFTVKDWWEQSSTDALLSKKYPVVIFTKNYCPDFIMLQTTVLNKLQKLVKASWKKFNYISYTMPADDNVIVLLLSDFLAWIDFTTLLKLTSLIKESH